jgi:hypothetical protein
VCSTIPWHQVQAFTIFAKHVAKRTWCDLQQLGAIGCYNSSLFEVPNIFGETLTKIVRPLFVQFQLVNKVFVYINDEHNNSCTFESVTSCKLLELKKPFASTCFGHMMDKVCQYASMKEVFIRGAQEFAKDHYIDKEKCEGALGGG